MAHDDDDAVTLQALRFSIAPPLPVPRKHSNGAARPREDAGLNSRVLIFYHAGWRLQAFSITAVCRVMRYYFDA